jgi:hypothetical protein
VRQGESGSQGEGLERMKRDYELQSTLNFNTNACRFYGAHDPPRLSTAAVQNLGQHIFSPARIRNADSEESACVKSDSSFSKHNHMISKK